MIISENIAGMKKVTFCFFFLSFIGSSFSQSLSMIIGDTTNISYHRILDPFDSVRQKIDGYPDSSYLDVNNDGRIDFLFLSKGNLEGVLGGTEGYFTITPFDSNAVMYEKMDTTTCYLPVTRPLIKAFSPMDLLTGETQNCAQKIFLNYYLWNMGDPCTISLGEFKELYIGVKLNSSYAKGLAWLRIQTVNGGYYIGPIGIIKEFAFKSQPNSADDMEQGRISVYPNPSFGKVTVDLRKIQEPCSLSVFDYSGQAVLESNFDSDIVVLDLKRGFYVLQVRSKKHGVIVEKVIVN
jgi:hypothetical protein